MDKGCKHQNRCKINSIYGHLNRVNNSLSQLSPDAQNLLHALVSLIQDLDHRMGTRVLAEGQQIAELTKIVRKMGEVIESQQKRIEELEAKLQA